MKRRRLLFAAVAMPLAVNLGACGRADPCANRIIDRLPDPGSDRIAYIFTRDCGATTGMATNVAIGRRGDDPSRAQIIFTADAGQGRALQEENGAIWLRGSWTAPGTLSIAYAEHSRLFRTDASALGATIRYRASAPPVLPPVP